jgi:cytochrome b558/566 subunit A
MERKKMTIIIVAIALSISITSMFIQIPLAQTSPQIIAYKVTGKANLGNPGSEQFWGNIPWANVTLSSNLQGVPTSGLTPYLLVKAAWNGSYLFVLMRWPSPNPAFDTWSAAAASFVPPSLLSKTTKNGIADWQELMPGTTYNISQNYSNFVSYVNGNLYKGRIVLNYQGLSIPLPNDTSIMITTNHTILVPDNRGFQWLFDNYGLFYGYYVNSSWYYPDRAAIMWYMGTGSNPGDCMNVGGDYPNENFDGYVIPKVGGSLSSGPASIWMWVSGATWNSSEDPAFQINMWSNTSITGLNYTDQGNHGFAVPLYTNQTALYEVDTSGIWYPPVQQGGLNGSLFYIWTGANWSNGYWTLEYIRPMTTPSYLAYYEPQFQVGKEYDVAFAIWQGKEGETLFDKSITSSFLTLYISQQTPPTSTSYSSSTSSTTLTNSSTIIPSQAINAVTLTVTVMGTIIAIIALAILYLVYRR